MMPGGSALAIRHRRRVLLDAVQYKKMFVSVTFITVLIRLVYYVVSTRK